MRKKMIEVAIPLDAINRESAREKSIRHGHPSTLHLWWARRPLAACRAVLFASLVDDPDSDPANLTPDGAVDREKAEKRRGELFALIDELVRWENVEDSSVIGRARAEIASSFVSSKVLDEKKWSLQQEVCGESAKRFIERTAKPANVSRLLAEHVPPVWDPFCGGGSIPLEAQRLGLRALATDLNPVPVLINKALIEIPSTFSGRPPIQSVSSLATSKTRGAVKQKRISEREWRGVEGLAEDVRYYGQWIREEAERRIGDLYPRVDITEQIASNNPDVRLYVGQSLQVIAWLWARTVASPNPAAMGKHIPLVRSFWLSTRPRNRTWIEPVVDEKSLAYRFEVRCGDGEPPPGTIGKKGDRCLLTDSVLSRAHIRSEAQSGRMGVRLLAIVAEGKGERCFLPPTEEHETAALSVSAPPDVFDTEIVGDSRYLTPISYGMTKHRDLFTSRQLAALSCFCSLIPEVHAKVMADANGDKAYADAVATYLAFAFDKVVDRHSSIATWDSSPSKLQLRNTFARHALQMTWDFGEGNPFSMSSGTWTPSVEFVAKAIAALPASGMGTVRQCNAAELSGTGYCFSTDPPYYDNVPYADLSDFFYIWLRAGLKNIYPDLLRTVLVPKSEELVADPFRQGGRSKAKEFFERGMNRVLQQMRQSSDACTPATIYYAFKQTESEADVDGEEVDATVLRSSTGWETFLQGLVDTGWRITATWPMRTELGNRMRSMGSNALASSIVLACRPRDSDAPMTSRKEFVAALKRELPSALRELQSGNIAPVDLAQAAIGPGMAVYSRYSKVLESSGERLTVRTALALINQVLDEVLAEQEGDYDADTRWSLKWFEQFAHGDGPFGDANTLATAMSIGINGLVETGIVQARAGKVRLLKRPELMSGHPETWDPATDTDIVHWEVCQYLIHALDTKGEAGAAALLRRINARYPGASETARELAYRLYTICERKKWAQDAMAYNSLIVAWPEIVKLSQSSDGSGGEAQTTMF